MEQKKYKSHAIMTIVICFFISFIEGIDLQSAGVAAAGMMEEFHLDKSKLGLIFSAAMLGLLPGGIVGGWLADRIGRKKVLIFSVVFFGIFSLATAFVSNYNELLIVRFMTGLGLGAALPNLIVIATEAVNEEKRGRAIAFMYCGIPAGGMFISFLASTHLAADWKVVFYIGGILPLLVVPVMVLLLPESREFLESKNRQKIATIKTKFSDLFNQQFRKATILLAIAYFFTSMVVYMLMNWLPSLFIDLGFKKEQANSIQMFLAIGAIFGTVIFGFLIDRWKMKYVVILMYLGTIAGLIALKSFSTVHALYFAAIVTGFFTLGGKLVLYALASLVYPVEIRGTGVGTAMTVARLGGVVGPAFAGLFLVFGGGTASLLAAFIPGIIISAILLMILLNSFRSAHA